MNKNNGFAIGHHDSMASSVGVHDSVNGDTCCGNCMHGIQQTDGQYYRCALYNVFHKYNDSSCGDWQKGGLS